METDMKIGILQSKPPFDYDVNDPGEYDRELCEKLFSEYLDKEFSRMESALSDGVDMLVTVEAFNVYVKPFDKRYNFADFAATLDGELVGRFLALTKKYSAYIVAGLHTLEGGKVYNSAVLCGPEGKIEGVYHKVHLPAGEELYTEAGDSYEIYKTPFGNIGMLVCWDLQYPEAYSMSHVGLRDDLRSRKGV